ncbi:(Fe-S)-binding protein [Methylomagnum sp.]
MSQSNLVTDTDLCVKCGLCLPHCPTYAKTRDENESPRGRISLIQGWAGGVLEATPQLVRHVDNCLLCRACEAACPAYVPYARIVDQFRQETGALGKALPAKIKSAALRKTLTGPWISRWVRSASDTATGRFIQHSGIARMVGMGDVAAGLPDAAPNKDWTGLHPAQGKEIARAALFLGCTASLLDAETVASAIRLMNRLGVSVRVPEAQGCCGAMHWHAGDRASATEFVARNVAAFGDDEGEAIVSFASGCGAMLHDYGDAFPSAEAQNISRRVRDISQFLADLPWPEDFQLKPLTATVCLHSPCSLKNVLRADRHAAQLLGRIPALKVVPLSAQTRCCGAAGSYMLEHPGMAATLRDDVLDQVLAARPDFLVTSNPGCALHLRAGLKRRAGQGVKLVHPVTLLGWQIGD